TEKEKKEKEKREGKSGRVKERKFAALTLCHCSGESLAVQVDNRELSVVKNGRCNSELLGSEFFNTISNAPVVILAFIGLVNALRQRFEKRFSILHLSNIALAIGGIIYHATLQRVLQSSDETPMVWEMLLYIYILYSPDWQYKSTMPTFLFLYGAAFAVVHALLHLGVVFKLHYVLLCLLCIPRMYKYYIYTKDVKAKRLAKLYLITLVLGSICWISDRALCKKFSGWHFNPQGHALWHVIMGFNFYFANTFLMFSRADQLGWNPQVLHLMDILPYVKIQKPKTQ
ncbi:hypothetical protein V2J09_014402, partial [Rumex salicifolius]